MIPRPAGFTVIELMITVTLVAVLAMVAAPSLRDLNRNARMTSQTNDLMTDLAIARSEAAKRGVHTAICTSNTGAACTATGWNQGWIIYLDPDRNGTLAAATDILKISPAVEGWDAVPANTANTITSGGLPPTLPGGADWIGFRPSGIAKLGAVVPPAVAPQAVFTLCDARTTAAVGGIANNKGRRVIVSQTGRALSQQFTCADNPPP